MISEVRYLESENMRSHLERFLVNELVIEVIGDIQKRLDDDSWVDPRDLPSIIRSLDLEGRNIPVLDLKYEKEAYRILGRSDSSET
jgi:hypothetical protein